MDKITRLLTGRKAMTPLLIVVLREAASPGFQWAPVAADLRRLQRARIRQLVRPSHPHGLPRQAVVVAPRFLATLWNGASINGTIMSRISLRVVPHPN